MKREKDPNFKVNITTITKIKPHPNPNVHSLSIAEVYGFEVVISSKSGYHVGQKVVYLPVNSVLPANIENLLFPPESKIKLEKARIKAVRIQKFVSQGMIVPWDKIKSICKLKEYNVETDLQDVINVVKYYPPVKNIAQNNTGEKKKNTPRNKPLENPYFKQYNGCTNIKWEPYAFSEEDFVYIQEKIHGSNFRCGWLPATPQNLWEKVKKFFKFFPEYEFCYGSNTVQRQKKQNSPTWYNQDIYAEIVHKYNLKEKLKDYPGHVLYGEIYGPSVQKGYHYGLHNDERKLVVFDVLFQEKNDQNWLNFDHFNEFMTELELPVVPTLYIGKWDKEFAIKLATGDSFFCEDQKVIEGVVVKNYNVTSLNRKKIKIINPEYLMAEAEGKTSDNTEFDNDFETDVQGNTKEENS